MISIWNNLLIQDGFDGIYIVAMQCHPGIKGSELMKYPSVEAVMPFEPLNVRSNSSNSSIAYVYKRRIKTVIHRIRNKIVRMHQTPEIYDYKWASKMIFKEKHDCKKFYCAFPDWDNTPRYQSKGVCFRGSTPELFEKQMTTLLRRSIDESAEILFINAWNEWGESAYLEPDERFEDAYLQAVKKSVNTCFEEHV